MPVKAPEIIRGYATTVRAVSALTMTAITAALSAASITATWCDPTGIIIPREAPAGTCAESTSAPSTFTESAPLVAFATETLAYLTGSTTLEQAARQNVVIAMAN